MPTYVKILWILFTILAWMALCAVLWLLDGKARNDAFYCILSAPLYLFPLLLYFVTRRIYRAHRD